MFNYLFDMSVFDTTYNNSLLEYETTDIFGWTVKFQPDLWSHSPEVRELLTEMGFNGDEVPVVKVSFFINDFFFLI